MLCSLVIATVAFGATPTMNASLQQGGAQGIYQGGALQQIDQRLSMYLNAEMQKSILTPGRNGRLAPQHESGRSRDRRGAERLLRPRRGDRRRIGEKARGERRSLPGDQRPLVFWRCEGTAPTPSECDPIKTRPAAKFTLASTPTRRSTSTPAPRWTASSTPPSRSWRGFPLKAGQVVDFVSEKMGEGNYINYRFDAIIYPNGLPELSPSLAEE